MRTTLVSSETIFEIRWRLVTQSVRELGPEDLPSNLTDLMALIMESPSDPWYTAGAERIATAIQQRYPRKERLPSALVPPLPGSFHRPGAVSVSDRLALGSDRPGHRHL